MNVWQDDVLGVRDAQFVEAVALGEVGHQVDLVGRGEMSFRQPQSADAETQGSILGYQARSE